MLFRHLSPARWFNHFDRDQPINDHLLIIKTIFAVLAGISSCAPDKINRVQAARRRIFAPRQRCEVDPRDAGFVRPPFAKGALPSGRRAERLTLEVIAPQARLSLRLCHLEALIRRERSNHVTPQFGLFVRARERRRIAVAQPLRLLLILRSKIRFRHKHLAKLGELLRVRYSRLLLSRGGSLTRTHQRNQYQGEPPIHRGSFDQSLLPFNRMHAPLGCAQQSFNVWFGSEADVRPISILRAKACFEHSHPQVLYVPPCDPMLGCRSRPVVLSVSSIAVDYRRSRTAPLR